jgi:CubicO group peptidase (beta-lactamase class C family)
LPWGLLWLPGLSHGQHNGLTAAGAQQLGDWLRAEVAAGRMPGAVLMVRRGGKPVFSQAVGRRDPASPAPMREDDLFRIFSMTKPIVSVAAMMLVEEGKLELDAPVAKYIPAFARMKVGVEQTGMLGQKTMELVDAPQPMAVRDLLRHTSGLTYGFFGPGLVKPAYRESGLESARAIDNAQFAERIAKLPLAYRPGSTWDCGNSTDVLGRVLEVACGQPLGALLKASLFEPLGMKDTAFSVPDAPRQARIAEPFGGDGITPSSTLFDPRRPTAFESGGGGLISTAPDYARFLPMLRKGGELDGRRYLQAATLQDMTRDQLG